MFAELWPRMTDVLNGKQGLRVRSQPMIFSLEDIPEINNFYQNCIRNFGEVKATSYLVEHSWEDHLNIKKWEYLAPAPAVIGECSTLIQRPACWRIQDVAEHVFDPREANTRIYQVTEKLDGVSMYVYKVSNDSKALLEFFPPLRPMPIAAGKPDGVDNADGQCIPIPPTMQTERYRVGVCNNSHEFFDDGKNIYWETAKASGIVAKIHQIPYRNIVVQGELVGSTIHGNTMNYPLCKHEFFVFGI